LSEPQPGHLAAASAPLRFGAAGRFVLQPLERRLLVDGQPAALGARALDVLITLATRPDHLISNNELLDRVWSGLVVEEANLQVQISNLRKVLGGDVISTVPGRGYRFVAPLMAADRAAAAPVSAPVSASFSAAPGVAAAPISAAGRPLPRLFGRDDDLARLEDTLPSAACVTLVGPAGVGKTSLARAVAARARDRHERCVWVDLAPLVSADQLAGACARALQLSLDPGDALPQLLRGLQGQALLIVLDNAEHLVQGCAELAAQLCAQPGVRLLVTSQLPLAVAAERVQRVAPLALAPDGEQARAGEGALALLIDRIAAAGHRLPPSQDALGVLSEICVQLDGLPLALEMAAARVPVMGVQGVRDGLAQRFALLTRGARDAPSRHRTLHDAVDWSYRLLGADEQRLFRALGVFAGGFTLELMLATMGEPGSAADGAARWPLIDALGVLVDRSLVSVSATDPPRYRLLDTLRAFALQALAASAGEHDLVRRRHADAVAALFTRYEPGDSAVEALCMAEMENAREAIDWAREHHLAQAARITPRAARVSTFHVWRNECTQWLHALQPAMSSAAGLALPAALQAAWWTELARTASFQGDAGASAVARRALGLWQPLQQPSQALFAAVVWVRAVTRPGAELDEACAALQAQAAALPAASARERFLLHGALTKAALVRGDQPAVLEGRLAEMALARELGSQDMVDAAESNVVIALNALQRHADAAERGRALLARIDARRADTSANLPWVMSGLLEALVESGQLTEAQALVPRLFTLWRRFGALTVLPILPRLLVAQGRTEAAARLHGHVQHAFASRGVTPGGGDDLLLAEAARALQAALGSGRAQSLMDEGGSLDDDAAQALAIG